MRRIWAVLILALMAAMLSAGGPSQTGISVARADVNCSDFSTQAAAQSYFNSHDPSADPDGLDEDHDGVACESNPCPCATGGGGGGGGGLHSGGHHRHHHKKKHRKPRVEQPPIAGIPTFVPTRCFVADGYQPLSIESNYCAGDIPDANVGSLAWASWTASSATATGTLHYLLCTDNPNRVCQPATDVSASLTLFRARYCRPAHRNVFTRMALSAPDAQYDYLRSGVIPFPCSTFHR